MEERSVCHGRESMKQTIAIVALAGLLSGVAAAGEGVMSVTLNTEQAQARQFGIYFGGTASQYDLCVKRGFLSKADQSAEEIAKSIFGQMRALNKGPDQSAYMQEGWDMIKSEIVEHESFFTQDKCAAVGKEWAKMMASMRKKKGEAPPQLSGAPGCRYIRRSTKGERLMNFGRHAFAWNGLRPALVA